MNQFPLRTKVYTHPHYKSGAWRLGQTYFNVLADEFEALAKSINNTDLDPFYKDDRIPAFLEWWDNLWMNCGDTSATS